MGGPCAPAGVGPEEASQNALERTAPALCPVLAHYFVITRIDGQSMQEPLLLRLSTQE
jgi:hypothetical protein